MHSTLSPGALRQSIRSGYFSGNTSGRVPGCEQSNVIILPVYDAQHRIRFCQLNPGPCPLVTVGDGCDPGCMLLTDVRNSQLAVM